MNAPDTPTDRAPSRSRRRRRWALGLLAAPLVLILGLLATQGWWLPALVRPAVLRLSGFESSAGAMRLTWRGGIHAREFKLREPDAVGIATVSVKRVEAFINWRRLFTGRLALRDIVLTEPVIRISTDAAGVPDGADAIQQARRGLRGFDSLPEMEVIDGAIEFIGNGSPAGEALVAVSGGGTLRREPGDHARYEVRLLQTGAGDAVSIDGWIDLTDRTAQLRTGELDLSRWIDSFVMEDSAAFWRSVVTGGRLLSAQVDYSPDMGVVSQMDIDDVRLALPMPRTAGGDVERMILDEVNGRVQVRGSTVRATVEGLVDGLPTSATIEADGLALTAPFRCSFVGGPFMVDRTWKPLALTSSDVQSLLRDFSGPSAEIIARVDLRRDAPSSAADEGIDVTGEVRIDHGAATFVEFPYPMREVSGVVTFDDEIIRIEHLEGVGPTGAALSASGVVIPDPTGVGLELTVHAERAPVDDVLFECFSGAERAIIESLFDRERAARLAAEGVFASEEQKRDAQEAIDRLSDDLAKARNEGDQSRVDSLRAAIADLRRIAERPTFDLAGLATVDIQIGRDAGSEPRRRLYVEARLERAGLLYSKFPYPVFVEPLVMRIDYDSVDVVEAPLVGLTGARGELTGSVKYRSAEAAPDLSIRFTTMPVDAAVLAAVSMVTEDQAQASPVRASGASGDLLSGATIGGVLRGLGAAGAVSGEAVIVDGANGGVDWSVETALSGLELRPDSSMPDRELIVDGFVGTLRVTPDAWRVKEGVAAVNGDPVQFNLENTFGADSAIDVSFSSPSFHAETPIEDLIRIIDAEASASIARLRTAADLAGPVSIQGAAAFGDGVESRRIEVAGAGELALTMDGRTSRIMPREGRIALDGEALRLEDLSVELLDHLGASSGVVDLAGVVELNAGGALELAATNLAIETPLAREAIRSMHGNLSDWFDDAAPAGRLDASATLRREPGAPWRAVSARAEPKSLRFVAGTERVALNHISGAITLDEAGGRVEDLQVQAQSWSATLDGPWYSGVTPGAQLRLSASGERLSDDILALLPGDVRDVFDAMNIRIENGFELRDGELAANAPVQGEDLGDGFRDGIRFSGRVRCAGASIDAGVPFTAIDGVISVNAERAPFSSETDVRIDMELDSLRAAGLTAQDVTATIRSASDRDRTLVVRLLGECHDGRVWGEGEIRTTGPSSEDRGGYEFGLRLSGLDLATAMHEFAKVGDGEPAPELGERGYVDASLVVGGDLVGGAPPRGAGELRILGGELVRLPLVMTVLELGNIIPPIGERLDYARADFSLANGEARFDRLLVVSPSISLVGEGTVSLPEFGLDLRFGAVGNYRLPLFSAIFDVLRNELLTTRVRGTLAAPEFSVVQLSGTRRFFSSIFGGGDSDGEPPVATAPEQPN